MMEEVLISSILRVCEGKNIVHDEVRSCGCLDVVI